VGRREGEKVEVGRQSEEGEKVRGWEGERVEVGSGNAAFVKLRRGKVGMQVSTEANQYRTPIIAMTAHAMSGDEQKSLDAGMNDHVTKPIDPERLFATLQKWIKPKPAAVSKPQVNDAPL